MVPDLVEGSVLLSYDVPRGVRSIAARVSHVVFGRGDEGHGSPPPFIRRPGVVWLGQSVLLLPPATARELALRLEAMGARVAMARIAVERDELEAFRRRMRRRLDP